MGVDVLPFGWRGLYLVGLGPLLLLAAWRRALPETVHELAEAPAGFFGPKYLQDVHGWTPAAIGLLTIGRGALAIVWNMVAGWGSDRWGRRRVAAGLYSGAGGVDAGLL
jgi:hypothetical protein